MKKEINNGILYIDGCSTIDLAKEYGTPLYIMSENAIIQRMGEIKDEFINKYPNVKAAYAAKAFCTIAMCKICEKEGFGIDVVSGGELYTAIMADFPPERIEFNGNNKSKTEIEMAVDYGIGRIIIDGLNEIELIERVCKEKGKTVNVLFRINPGVEADSHEYIITGKKDSKFGIPLDENTIYPLIKKAIDSEYVNFLGFHFHIGSQIFEKAVYLSALEVVIKLVKEVKARFSFDIKELNIGGGFGVTYTDEERKPYNYYLDPVMKRLSDFYEEMGVERPTVVIEPGRSIVAEAGITLYTIGSIKNIEGVRKYVSVDGGMTDNIRPALYSAKYEGVLANRADDPATDTVTIAGKCCESGDILIRDIEVSKSIQEGDLFAIFNTGAYGYSMASNYNRNLIPPVVLIEDGSSRLIVKGQTYEELLLMEMR